MPAVAPARPHPPVPESWHQTGPAGRTGGWLRNPGFHSPCITPGNAQRPSCGLLATCWHDPVELLRGKLTGTGGKSIVVAIDALLRCPHAARLCGLRLRTRVPIGRRDRDMEKRGEGSGGLDCQVAKVGRCRPSGTSPIRKQRSGTVEIHACGMEALTTAGREAPRRKLLTKIV